MSRAAGAAGPALDALLASAFLAYREGLRRQPQAAAAMPRRNYERLTFLGSLGRVPPADRLRLRRLHGACGEGLEAARLGRLDQARAWYEAARGQLDRLADGAPAARLLGTSTYCSGVAYLEFRRGADGPATECLEQALDADLALERMDLPVMQMHRIQVGHNLVRVDLRFGRRDRAVELAGLLLAYLERRVAELPYHRAWRARGLRAVPRSLQQGMIHQIVGETAGFIVTGEAPEAEWRRLLAASRLHADPEAALFPPVQHALGAQRDRLAGDGEGYLQSLERFFRGGIRGSHRLWYPLLIELADFCAEVDTETAREVRGLLLRDSAKWKALPPALRDRLAAPPARRVA